jgi:uncharacterized repeat protein (TIGR01451 family)
MRRTILLVSTMTIAVLAVSGVMLFGMGKPAQSQSDHGPACGGAICLHKTADPNPVNVGQPITFTISQRCHGNVDLCFSSLFLIDKLPADAGLTNVSVQQPRFPAKCTLSGQVVHTVTCSGDRTFTPAAPFTVTIVATPTECGTFTNTVSATGQGETFTARATFTVLCRHTLPPRGPRGF